MEEKPSDNTEVEMWKAQKLAIPVEGFRNHVATDGSPLGASGNWCACGWSVVQLDEDEEMGPLHGMCGTLDAEPEVRRTIIKSRANGFLVSPQKSHLSCDGALGQEHRTPTCGL